MTSDMSRAGTEQHARSERGVVLISVLAVTAVIAAIAWQMVSRQSLVVASASGASFTLQAQEYLIGAEQYARQLLAEDWQDEASRLFDSEDEDWATTRAPFEIPGGEIEIRVWDMQSKFNLNAADTQPDAFQALLTHFQMPADIASEWADWIDEDAESRTPGAEDMELLLQMPALRSANALAADASEIRFLPTMLDAYNDEFGELLVALPTINLELNINTVEATLLEALGFEPAVAEAIVSGERNYENVEDVDLLEAGEGSAYFVTTSRFFAVQAQVAINDRRARMESHLYRSPQDGTVHLVGRNFESA
ncbi:MAG: type II secretion system minor pseudopilin GspK [Gammaproteobacteria bacterium]|nr:type II secretion system minor pseudopilin GspK [Gammaproteobacteria bacterium]MCY4200396.1 type II secretion system minor pseudopilin GspK [Gammaproteobacteria bacterium]MCY4276371.1 type II secretion system minor pseudopilin GspK [Gammaproteobacteria bacterium]MCY4323998.1 type II secretion system minor pseudopilin GspK [Gammaproteobacteria bacterium]